MAIKTPKLDLTRNKDARGLLTGIQQLRQTGKFIHPNIPFTPAVLCNEIINNIKMVDKTSSIAVLFTIEMAVVLKTKGFNNITVITDEIDIVTSRLADIIGCKYKTLKEVEEMKFDVVVGNPPYSKGRVALYSHFFKLSLELAECVVMLMPYKIDGQNMQKAHNLLVKTHATYVSKNVTNLFNVGVTDIRYVIASRSHINVVAPIGDPLSSYNEILPEHSRISFLSGPGSFSQSENEDIVNGVPCIDTVHRGNIIKWRNIKVAIAEKQKSKTDAPWLVLVHKYPYGGLFNVAICENNNTKWSGKIYVLPAVSKKEAEIIQQWMVSDIIKNEVIKLLLLKDTYAVNTAMMHKLPYYK